MADPVRSGALLFRHLPDEYRFRDRRDDGKPGDLERLLDGFGTLLDSLRETIAQFHADGFADAEDRPIQTWAIPYLADLVAAELMAPAPAARRAELARTVAWHKSKGTLAAADDIADTIAGVETVTVEGWRRTLVTARSASERGLPNVRRCARAVLGAGLDDPLAILTVPQRDGSGSPGRVSRPYRIHGLGGIPGARNAFDDPSPRLPDMRASRRGQLPGPHPARVVVHVLPPEGFFGRGLKRIPFKAAFVGAVAEGRRHLSPRTVHAAGGVAVELDRLTLSGNIDVPADTVLAVKDLNLDGEVRVPSGSSLELVRCAVRKVTLSGSSAQPELRARDTLLGSVEAPHGRAQLEYVTILGDLRAARLDASEALFDGKLEGVVCGPSSCIRYSRVPAKFLAAHPQCGGTNTAAEPLFASRVVDFGPGCTPTVPSWGQIGCGVLAWDAPAEIRTGAEDEGEIGAYHHLYHAASLGALERRLRDALPFGVSLAMAHDLRLELAPPVLEGGDQ